MKLPIARHIKNTWNLTKILELLNEELKVHETVNVEGRNVDSDGMLPLTGSSLVVGLRGTSHQSMKSCFARGLIGPTNVMLSRMPLLQKSS